MKKLYLIVALLLALALSGCGNNTAKITENVTATPATDTASATEKVTVAPATDSPAKTEITEEEAAGILTDYLKTIGISKEADPNLTMALDRTDEADGKKYYVFQVFDDMEDHTATLGWYGVQIANGSLYDFMLMEAID